MEAMTLAKPVIVTDNPGYNGIINNGENGYIVPGGNVDALTQAISNILNDAELSRRFSRQAGKKAEQVFDVKITAQHVQNIYNKYLN